jgi:TRAP-type C4-dicarboxylate transport system substrate-binding protein
MFIRFADQLEEETDGRITGEVLAQQVGGGEDHLNATADGTIDMHGQSVATVTANFGPEYGFVGTPFIPQDWEHHVTMWEEYIEPMDEFNGQLVEDANQRVIGTGKYGVRSVTSNEPIRTPEDLSGVQMRVPQINSWTNVWNAVGAEATPVAYDELYQSLQTGVVGASEGPIKQVFDASLYEVQSHFSLTEHLPTDTTVTVNEETWQSFSDSDRELVQRVLDENLEWLNETVDSNESSFLEEAQEEHDMTIVEDVDREAFVEASREAHESMSEEWLIGYQEALDMA